MSWIKKNFSCFQHDKRGSGGRESDKTTGPKSSCEPTKSEVSDKNIQCDFDGDFVEERVGNGVCRKGQ